MSGCFRDSQFGIDFIKHVKSAIFNANKRKKNLLFYNAVPHK